MGHLVKKFYKTSQDALREQSVLRKRNLRLEYTLESAYHELGLSSKVIADIKTELIEKKVKDKNMFKAGFVACQEQFKVISN